MLYGEVVVSVLAPSSTRIRALKSIRIQNVKLFPDSNPSTCFFIGLYLKFTIIKVEGITLLVVDYWEYALFHYVLVRIIVIAPKHEYVIRP